MTTVRSLWLLLVAVPSAAAAAEADDGTCRNGTFGVDNSIVGLGAVTGTGRAAFVADTGGCPNASAGCRLKSYLVGGDRVVTGRTRGKYVCVFYPSRGRGTAGWLETARLKSLPVRSGPPASAWLGQWSDEGNPRVRFTQRQGKLTVQGDAAWPSFNPSPKERPGGPNIGEIAEAVRTSGNRAYAPECRITFTLLGDLLVGADPQMQCGGLNVSFSGVYKRVPPRR